VWSAWVYGEGGGLSAVVVVGDDEGEGKGRSQKEGTEPNSLKSIRTAIGTPQGAEAPASANTYETQIHQKLRHHLPASRIFPCAFRVAAAASAPRRSFFAVVGDDDDTPLPLPFLLLRIHPHMYICTGSYHSLLLKKHAFTRF
jgi:hypothetical protein